MMFLRNVFFLVLLSSSPAAAGCADGTDSCQMVEDETSFIQTQIQLHNTGVIDEADKALIMEQFPEQAKEMFKKHDKKDPQVTDADKKALEDEKTSLADKEDEDEDDESEADGPVKVKCKTTAGDFTVTTDPANSPLGVARFLELVKVGFFKDQMLYRVISGFLVQFGVAADPKVQAIYQEATIQDEPNKVPFRAGTLSFAGNGDNSRTCHLFVALDPQGKTLGHAAHETTIGQVDAQGIKTFMQVAMNHDKALYGDTAYLQDQLVRKGNDAAIQFPKMDKILSCAKVGGSSLVAGGSEQSNEKSSARLVSSSSIVCLVLAVLAFQF